MGRLRLPETETEYRNALVDAAELGAMKALETAGLLKPYIKLREANRMYGSAIVGRWYQEGLIHFIKDGNNNSSVRIDRIEIEATAKASNRGTYLSTKERNA